MDLHLKPEAELLSILPQKILLHNQSNTVTPDVTNTSNTTPKSLTTERLQALLQMLKTDPSCKCISKWLSNRNAPKHEANLLWHVKGLLYKHVTDWNKKFLALVIPKAWKYTVLVETHDKLGHQGAAHMYCIIKCQYYWKVMNRDIRKYIDQCTLPQGKSKVQAYPLQMTKILEWPFNKTATGSPHRMTESFSHTRQISRYHSIHVHQSLPSSPQVP